MLRVGGPGVVGLIVAGAMVAVALGERGIEQGGDFCVRNELLRLWVGSLDLEEIATGIDPGSGFAVGRLANAFRRITGEVAGMAEDLGDGPGTVGLRAQEPWQGRETDEKQEEK